MTGLLDVRSREGLTNWEWMTEPITKEVFEHVLGLYDAFWHHIGGPCPEQPHVLLTSGLHSDGFINLGAVLKALPGFRQQLAWHLLESMPSIAIRKVDAAVGSDTSATDLAGDVAHVLDVRHLRMTKTETAEGKRQVWPSGQVSVAYGDHILQVEELITTASSSQAVRHGIQVRCGIVNYVPYIYCLVDRSDPKSGLQQVQGSMGFRSLFRYPIRNFDPTECPYCAAGSEPLAPKANWGRLVAPEQWARCACGCWHNIAENCPG